MIAEGQVHGQSALAILVQDDVSGLSALDCVPGSLETGNQILHVFGCAHGDRLGHALAAVKKNFSGLGVDNWRPYTHNGYMDIFGIKKRRERAFARQSAIAYLSEAAFWKGTHLAYEDDDALLAMDTEDALAILTDRFLGVRTA